MSKNVVFDPSHTQNKGGGGGKFQPPHNPSKPQQNPQQQHQQNQPRDKQTPKVSKASGGRTRIYQRLSQFHWHGWDWIVKAKGEYFYDTGLPVDTTINVIEAGYIYFSEGIYQLVDKDEMPELYEFLTNEIVDLHGRLDTMLDFWNEHHTADGRLKSKRQQRKETSEQQRVERPARPWLGYLLIIGMMALGVVIIISNGPF